MKDWLLLQGFYHGLQHPSRERLDAIAEGSFLSLTPGKAKSLMEKISENQGYTQSNAQDCHQSEETVEEFNKVSMEVLMNWLERRAIEKRDRRAIEDSMKSTPKTSLVVNNSATTPSTQELKLPP